MIIFNFQKTIKYKNLIINTLNCYLSAFVNLMIKYAFKSGLKFINLITKENKII